MHIIGFFKFCSIQFTCMWKIRMANSNTKTKSLIHSPVLLKCSDSCVWYPQCWVQGVVKSKMFKPMQSSDGQAWKGVVYLCLNVIVSVCTCLCLPAAGGRLAILYSVWRCRMCLFVCVLCMIVRVYVYIYVCTGSSRRACCALFNLEAAGADSGRTAHLVGRRLLHIGPAQNQHRPMQAMNPIHIRNLRKIKQWTNLAEKKCGEYLISCIVLLEKDFLSTFNKNTTPII